ncbi:hypothetical protein B0H12DRAFT_1069437 [Mycena haematopus]|nr:hypothetical protein B0H12DRAFT_1069437 [Mycena haematopus]
MSCLPSSNFFINDFQGLVLDLTSAFGPVTTQLLDEPVPSNQQWEFVTVNNGLVLASGLSLPGEIIVVARGPNGEAVGASSTSIAFNITCFPDVWWTMSLGLLSHRLRWGAR